MNYTCIKCGKVYSNKSSYTKHLNRKTQCSSSSSCSSSNENFTKINITSTILAMKNRLLNENQPQLENVCDDDAELNNEIVPEEIETIQESEESEEHEIKEEENQYTFIEVCAGGGGLSSGLMKAGFIPLLLNDNNRDCCETLRQNHPNTNVFCGSMNNIDFNPYVDRVDLLTGGVPCQSFSQAGKRLGLEDDRGELIIDFINIVHKIHPKIFMIENVKGLITHDSGNTIEHIIQLFKQEDMYHVSYQLLNAHDYGVPQKRERVFIVGTRKDLPIHFAFPNKLKKKKNVGDVLANVPESKGIKYSADKEKLFEYIPQGGCWIHLPTELQMSYLGNSYYSGGGKRGILYRLAMDKPSLTLLCSPTQKQTERCHPIENRPLTIREYARIQTFEDNYHFYGSIASQYKQIGNAVPVELARHMGLSLIKVLKSQSHND